LGRHPDPDGTFSFYGATPSGFDFEIGAASREIEPRGWRELRVDTTSSWGHRPTLGLQLRTVGSLVAARLGL
jgi:biphenyl-2,3-diol 1,2-dioxygenase